MRWTRSSVSSVDLVAEEPDAPDRSGARTAPRRRRARPLASASSSSGSLGTDAMMGPRTASAALRIGRRALGRGPGPVRRLAWSRTRSQSPPPAWPSTGTDVRNLAIIAHVDHGKTTMVDALLEIAGAFERGEDRPRAGARLRRPRARARHHHHQQADRARLPATCGSTSSTPPATPTSVARSSACSTWSTRVLLLVDAVEGPMPQTRFVTEKAVARGLPRAAAWSTRSIAPLRRRTRPST